MNEDILKETYTRICAEIDKLTAVKLAMEQAGVEAASRPALAKGGVHKSARRAPKGTLEQAILGVLEHKGKLVNREIRAKLKGQGYQYSLGSLHVGKTLSRMVGAKQIVLGHNGSRIEYSLK